MAMRRRTAGVLVGGAVVLLVFAYLLWGGIGENLVYFLTPTELLAKGTAAQGANLRVGGMVEAGSVHWDAERRELRFRLKDDGHAIDVVSSGAPPQMFAEGIGAVVEGVYAPDGVFRAHNLMVKHSNEYRPPKAGERPAEYYRRLFQRQQS